MTFHRVFRRPIVKKKPDPVPDDGIVLQWWANPTAPFLGIHIGYDLAHSIGLRGADSPAQLMIGENADFGKVAIRAYQNGDWWCRVRGGTWTAFLDSQTSLELFALCERTEIGGNSIKVSNGTAIFHIPRRVRAGGAA